MLVSVILCTHTLANYQNLAEAVDSLLEQIHPKTALAHEEDLSHIGAEKLSVVGTPIIRAGLGFVLGYVQGM